jgi:hypothetical protein
MRFLMTVKPYLFYPSCGMRFRAKFALIDWAGLTLAAFAWLLFFSEPHRVDAPLLWYVTLMNVFAGSRVVLYMFVYWETTIEGLRERRLWSTRTIPWPEITAIGPWPDRHPNRGFLAIEYTRPAPLSDRGTLVANPENREAFLGEIRRHAPQVRLEIPVSASPVPAR